MRQAASQLDFQSDCFPNKTSRNCSRASGSTKKYRAKRVAEQMADLALIFELKRSKGRAVRKAKAQLRHKSINVLLKPNEPRKLREAARLRRHHFGPLYRPKTLGR
eukprot:Selendium_serpulae@DN4998_c0_g1_i5.p1